MIRAPWVTYFGFTKTPFSKNLAAACRRTLKSGQSSTG